MNYFVKQSTTERKKKSQIYSKIHKNQVTLDLIAIAEDNLRRKKVALSYNDATRNGTSLRLIVLTMNRANSLLRLLNSLKDADYGPVPDNTNFFCPLVGSWGYSAK